MLSRLPLLRYRAMIVVVFTAMVGSGFAQAPPAEAPQPQSGQALALENPASQIETVQDLANRLTPDQKQVFEQGSNAFNEHRYEDAMAVFKKLLNQLPGDAVLSKFASESALYVGDPGFALTALKPIAAGNPNDWQAAAILTRACAETGDTNCRDAGMAHMLDLRRRGITPPTMQAYVLERVKTEKNTLVIRTSLFPYTPYKVYDLAQVINAEGKLFMRITIESSDGDQQLFATEHSKEAAAGMRRFSLDAYRETGLNASGQRTQAHFTYKFFDGQPTYDTVRDEFIKVADEKSKPITSRTGLIVQ